MKRALLLPLLLLVTACDGGILELGEVPEGRFLATFEDLSPAGGTEGVAGEFEGTGEFKEHFYAGTHPLFSVWSSGIGASEGERVIIRRYGGGVPSPGTYAIDLFEPRIDRGSAKGFTGQYVLTREGGVREAYFLTGGTVEILKAGPDRVEGTFEVTGVLRTSDGPFADIDPDAPRTRASGSFIAGPQPLGRSCPTVAGSGC